MVCGSAVHAIIHYKSISTLGTIISIMRPVFS